MTELLAPAGNAEAARAALFSGADAVYLGLKQFSARSGAENFTDTELKEIVTLAHLLGAKVYVALNTLVKDDELDGFFSSALCVWNAGADAILLQDLFLGRELKRRYPDMVLHLSTQAGCCNRDGARVAKEYGFSRAVLARETPLKDIAEISRIIETEVFVQGALCAAFSGQCYFSSFAGNNSGNRGRCKQPCRKKYRIDRAGFEEEAYALSLSDLCVGESVAQLLQAGVVSLKIEGRMRRPEYVAAAVKYYRALLDGMPASEAFSRMRRAYNRGDYTKGLAFGQKADFLSRDVQGHIGERVGTVSYRSGRPACVTDIPCGKGDGFKILRAGKEVCGAAFSEAFAGGFFLSASGRLKEGDEVRLTTSVRSDSIALLPVKSRKIAMQVSFYAGKPPRAVCGDFEFSEGEPLRPAETAPLTAEDIAASFQRTDGLPFDVTAEVATDGVFLPKSALNAFRRAFYAALVLWLCPPRMPLEPVGGEVSLSPERGTERAVIGEGDADIVICKPRDYAELIRPAGKNVYLYLPPFLSSDDEALIADKIARFDGIFAEGDYGIGLARRYGVELFAGPGFHVTNRYAVRGVREVAGRFVLSKELSKSEQDALSERGAFVLTGGVKVMDLIWCPFGRTCDRCDRKKTYRLTDEEGRKFPLRRYRFSGMVCRFEVYNCANLTACGTLASRIADATEGTECALSTKGHAERSMI